MIKVCTDPSFMVGDGETSMREKPLSTNCFIKSDNKENFLTIVQDFNSSPPCPRSPLKKSTAGERKKRKEMHQISDYGKTKHFIHLF